MGVLSLVVLVILTTIGIQFFGKKQSSNMGAAINDLHAPTKSQSQEVAQPQQSAPASGVLSVPAPQDCEVKSARRLANGFLLGDEARTGGHGIVKISNGTKYDAVVNLVASDSGETIRSVYIRNRDRVSLRQLTPGTYRAYFTLGMDWDDDEGLFVCNSDYKEFGRSLVLEERVDARGTEYSELEITLHPVIAGNVVSSPISRGAFHSTLPRRHSQRNPSE